MTVPIAAGPIPDLFVDDAARHVRAMADDDVPLSVAINRPWNRSAVVPARIDCPPQLLKPLKAGAAVPPRPSGRPAARRRPFCRGSAKRGV